MSANPVVEDHGLELESCEHNTLNGVEGVLGWAVYSGCDGDSPNFVGFFPKENQARWWLTFRDPDSDPNDGGLLYRDAIVVPAVLTSRGIYSANDCTIETHTQLCERVFTLLNKRGP